jgi:hypothetical protein
MKSTVSIRFRAFAPALIGAAVLAVTPGAQASDDYVAIWQDFYPDSSSDGAGCLLCHGSSTSNLNAYGADICREVGAIRDAILAVQDLDSDQDPTGSDNVTEIGANAQPGWTAGVNPIFSRSTCLQIATVDAPPSGVPTPYDPVLEPAALDLDIAQLRVSKNVRIGGKAVGIKLVVQNNGTVDTNGTATVTGEQGGSVVYSETLDVFDAVGNGKTTFELPDYAPTATGEILWTATIDDEDPDLDQETATTNVR